MLFFVGGDTLNYTDQRVLMGPQARPNSMLIEAAIIEFPPAVLERMTSSTGVSGRVGEIPFTFTAEQIEALRDLSSRWLKPAATKGSGKKKGK